MTFEELWAAAKHEFPAHAQRYAEAAMRVGFEMGRGNVLLEKAALLKADWFVHWKPYPMTKPELFQLVVTKTKSGVMTVDWLEPIGQRAVFCEEYGTVFWWMDLALFDAVAPESFRTHLHRPDAESLAVHAARKQAHSGVAEAVPETRTDHGQENR